MKTYIDGIYYDLNESSQTAKIIPHYDEDWILENRYNDNITIPPKVYYSELIFDVVEISAHAFRQSFIKSVIIPSSITTIETCAFAECHALTNITIPDTVKRIENGAFADCIELVSIVLPNQLVAMGGGLFYNCKKLKSISLPQNIIHLDSFENYRKKMIDEMKVVTRVEKFEDRP